MFPPGNEYSAECEQESGLLVKYIIFPLNLCWPVIFSSADGIGLFHRCAQCDQSGTCRTLQMKIKDLIFPQASAPQIHGCWGTSEASLIEDGLLDTAVQIYRTQKCNIDRIFFLHTRFPHLFLDGWMDLPPVDFFHQTSRIRTRPSLISLFI